MAPTIYIMKHTNSEETSVSDVLESHGYDTRSFLMSGANPEFEDNDILVLNVSSKRPQDFSFLQDILQSKTSPSVLVVGDRGDFLLESDVLKFERSSILLRPFQVTDLVEKVQNLVPTP